MNLIKFNKSQYQAVTSNSRNILVLAGAGTGKTAVLTHRIAYLLEQGVKESEILAFTFTNKAADEMKERFTILLNRSHGIHVSTFHSYCYYFLKDFHTQIAFEKNFSIIDDDDKLRFIKRIIKEDNLKVKDNEMIKAISFVKNHVCHDLNIYDQMILNYLFHKYQAYLKKSNKMDLDDLLYYTYSLLEHYPSLRESIQDSIKYILIDECQDTNKIQFEIIMLLSKDANLFLVGDIDQCIYSFRGSDLENINRLTLLKKPEIIKLEENFRSNSNILKCANSLINNNKERLEKELYTTKFDSNYQVIYAKLENEISEVNYTAKLIKILIEKGYSYDSIAILYRNNLISTAFEKEFITEKIPFKLHGSFPFFEHKEIKNLIAYYRLIYNPDDNLAFERIYNIPSRGIGENTFQEILSIAKQKDISYFESIKIIIAKKQQSELQKFLEFIIKMKKDFLVLQPDLFLKILIRELKYTEYIMKDIDSKSKMARLYHFYYMIDSIQVENQPEMATINFINEIYFKNLSLNNSNMVNLMTIHQAKGLEFRVVIIAGLNEGIIPSVHIKPQEIEEERRLFYVAITRARERLYLLSTHRRLINGRMINLSSSRFLSEINNCMINSIQ